MAIDIPTLRKLVSLDENDPLSRFALGKKLFEQADDEAMLREAAEHLQFANARAPEHLATYHILAQALLGLNRPADARIVLEEGIRRVGTVDQGMGRDLGPAMQDMLARLQ